MAITHGSFVFTHDHGDVAPFGPLDMAVSIGQFAGVKGESHIVDKPKGRELGCRYTMDGFETRAALEAAIKQIHDHQGEDGTITITGNLARELPKCTFVGFAHGEAFWDGSGVNGWVVRGMLRWRQRDYS